MILLILAVLTIASCTLGACPGGWEHHGQYCYFFGKNALNWTSARDVCNTKGGYLAEPKTKVESDYLEGFTRQYRIEYWGYWLGGTDKAVERQWIWSHSNEPFSRAYTDWNINEPNNADNDEDCLHLFPIYDMHWNDKECNFTMNYICEQKQPNGPVLGPLVPNFG